MHRSRASSGYSLGHGGGARVTAFREPPPSRRSAPRVRHSVPLVQAREWFGSSRATLAEELILLFRFAYGLL